MDNVAWRKSDIGETIPATRKQRNTLASLASRPTALLAWATMVGPRSFDLSATYLANSSIPYPSPCALTRRKGSRGWEPSVPHFLDLDLLGAMVQQEARSRGTPEKCGGGRR
jgi:hypothetical protein